MTLDDIENVRTRRDGNHLGDIETLARHVIEITVTIALRDVMRIIFAAESHIRGMRNRA